jgi:branched-chain amino acid transport system permease protein
VGFWLVVNFIKGPQEFVNVALDGLTRGSIYGVVALGYTLVYGILQLINFAHGDVFALSGLVAWSVIVNVIGLDEASSVIAVIGGLLVTMVVIMGGFALFNASVERVAYRPLRNAPRLAPLITAVGMSFIIQNISLAIYGVNYRTVPDFIPQTNAIHIGDVTYSWNKASVLFIVIPLLVILSWFVRTTKQGKAMRAVAQDTEASAMMGIDVNRTISVTFLLAGALAGAAGIVYLLQFNMRFDTGFELGLIAFTAAVLGGIGNLTGAVLGALMIGFIQAFNEGLSWLAPGSDWTRSMVFGILILVLVFRPEGILGEQTPEGA